LREGVPGGNQAAGADQPAALAEGHRLVPFPVRLAVALLHLDEHGGAAVARHHVDLARATAKVAVEDLKALLQQMLAGDRLAGLAGDLAPQQSRKKSRHFFLRHRVPLAVCSSTTPSAWSSPRARSARAK